MTFKGVVMRPPIISKSGGRGSFVIEALGVKDTGWALKWVEL
jgi:hypothetical protein